MEFPAGLTPVHFVRLAAQPDGTRVDIRKFLLARYGDRKLPGTAHPARGVTLRVTTEVARQGDQYLSCAQQLENRSRDPSARRATRSCGRAATGDRILPALYSDNFVPLMPGEKRTIETGVLTADARGEEPRISRRGLQHSSGQRFAEALLVESPGVPRSSRAGRAVAGVAKH